MRGPPGSRAPRPFSASHALRDDYEEGGLGGGGSSSSGGGSYSRPKKQSRLLLYIRLRHRELLRLGVAVLGGVVLLLLAAWLLTALTASATNYAADGFKSAQERMADSTSSGGGRQRARRGRVVERDPLTSLPVVRNPYSSGRGEKGGMGLTAGKGTDVYEAVREGETLGSWDRALGLQIDTWDPRTHDPLHLTRNAFGQLIEHPGQQKQAQQGQSSTGRPSDVPPQWFLTLTTFNRLFDGDVTNMSAYECMQWVEYYRYAGISHVLWYDTSVHPGNSVESALRQYVEEGYVTYLRFYTLFPGPGEEDMHYEQDKMIVHALQKYGDRTRWFAALDVDEYVAAPGDTKPGFLDRAVRAYERLNPEASQLLLQTFLFIGAPQRPRPALVMERYMMRSVESEGVSLLPNAMMKPLVRPADVRLVYYAQPQHMDMAGGKTMALPASLLHINHYWGPRLPDWEFRDRLVRDESMQPIADELKLLLSKRRKHRWGKWFGDRW